MKTLPDDQYFADIDRQIWDLFRVKRYDTVQIAAWLGIKHADAANRLAKLRDMGRE